MDYYTYFPAEPTARCKFSTFSSNEPSEHRRPPFSVHMHLRQTNTRTHRQTDRQPGLLKRRSFVSVPSWESASFYFDIDFVSPEKLENHVPFSGTFYFFWKLILWKPMDFWGLFPIPRFPMLEDVKWRRSHQVQCKYRPHTKVPEVVNVPWLKW